MIKDKVLKTLIVMGVSGVMFIVTLGVVGSMFVK